jgi:hypothetical protein
LLLSLSLSLLVLLLPIKLFPQLLYALLVGIAQGAVFAKCNDLTFNRMDPTYIWLLVFQCVGFCYIQRNLLRLQGKKGRVEAISAKRT